MDVEAATEYKKPHPVEMVKRDVNLANTLDAREFAQSVKRHYRLSFSKHEAILGLPNWHALTNEFDELRLTQSQLIKQRNECQVTVVRAVWRA